MFLLLLACGLLYLLLGDLGEAAVMSTAILVVIGITFIQERRTEKTLEALRDLSSPRALVIRNGTKQRIAGCDVVPDDLVIIEEGDRVPADGFLVANYSLKINESLLTGEAVPVAKTVWDGKASFAQIGGGEENSFVYSGSLVVQGSGRFLVSAIGEATAMGKIGASLKETERPPSKLQLDTSRVVKLVASFSITISILIALVFWLRDGESLQGILMGLTFAMSTVPEEFPVVLTVFMALGAWRISRQKVLTRQMNAIETLGSANCLCVDKTGTLTENRMTVSAFWTSETGAVLGADEARDAQKNMVVDRLIRWCALASDPGGSDPMDQAAVSFAKSNRSELFSGMKLERTFPLVRPLLAVGYGWREHDKTYIAIKGAPESVVSLCNLSATQQKDVLAAVQHLAERGYRVLAVGHTACEASWVEEQDQSLDRFTYEFSGLVGFSDPLRAGVKEAVAQCHSAGIKVIMMTGDYAATAVAIAKSAGISQDSAYLTGEDVSQLSDGALKKRLESVQVLARMIPEHKLRIVKLLQEDGAIVAMTGDGVNDAPSLKAAHIGIAMGNRGTDVAREASALVLLDDNFVSIVAAIRLGRRIYDNIKKAISYILVIHIPIIGLTLLPIAMGSTPILWPVHLAFLELIIDPVCSIVFEAEPEQPHVMDRPPRPATEKLFDRKILLSSLTEGFIAFFAVFAVYAYLQRTGVEPDHARAVAFVTLVLVNGALIASLRAGKDGIFASLRRPNAALHWIGGILLVVCGVILYAPAVAALFHFRAPHADDLGLALAIAFGVLLLFEALKAVLRRLSY